MKYDDASWHYEGNFPQDQPIEYGGTHIALFLKWCFIQGWAGELHATNHLEDVQKVIEGSLSATEFLFKHCDGKLTSQDLNEDGVAFANEYYGSNGLYLDDYFDDFNELMYVASESEHDFAKFSRTLDYRRGGGRLTKR